MNESHARLDEVQLVLFDPDCRDLRQDAESRSDPADPRAELEAGEGSMPRAGSAPAARLQTATERARHSITDPAPNHIARPVADVSVDDDARSSVYLQVEDVAKRLHCSRRTVHELTRTHAIPHRRLPGCRRCLFRENELDAWENGALLEVTELPRGGRRVVPRRSAA